MFTLFLIGNIASGKSTATRYLEKCGACRLDLDVMAKDLYVPGSPLVQNIADVFGWDILDQDGGIQSSILAERAFASPDATARLNAFVHPVLLEQLSHILLPVNCCSTMAPEFPLTVVEVSAAAAFTDAFGLADEIMAITAPLDVRRARAVERGMDADDFDRRAVAQPSEEELCALASVVIDNTAADHTMFDALGTWLNEHGLSIRGDHA